MQSGDEQHASHNTDSAGNCPLVEATRSKLDDTTAAAYLLLQPSLLLSSWSTLHVTAYANWLTHPVWMPAVVGTYV